MPARRPAPLGGRGHHGRMNRACRRVTAGPARPSTSSASMPGPYPGRSAQRSARPRTAVLPGIGAGRRRLSQPASQRCEQVYHVAVQVQDSGVALLPRRVVGLQRTRMPALVSRSNIASTSAGVLSPKARATGQHGRAESSTGAARGLAGIPDSERDPVTAGEAEFGLAHVLQHAAGLLDDASRSQVAITAGHQDLVQAQRRCPDQD